MVDFRNEWLSRKSVTVFPCVVFLFGTLYSQGTGTIISKIPPVDKGGGTQGVCLLFRHKTLPAKDDGSKAFSANHSRANHFEQYFKRQRDKDFTRYHGPYNFLYLMTQRKSGFCYNARFQMETTSQGPDAVQ